MDMFLKIDNKSPDKAALTDSSGNTLTYGDIIDFCGMFKKAVDHRTLIFVRCTNCVGAALGYLASIENRIVPLMVGRSMDTGLFENLVGIYRPEYIWQPSDDLEGTEKVVFEAYGYSLVQTGYDSCPMYEDLSMLLTTSGSTGSPKLVRHSYDNLEAQGKHISEFFEITGDDKALVDLPIYYTMGLSVLCSFLYAGAKCCLTSYNVLDPEYWSFWKENRITVFTNIPYTYEMLDRMRFFKMNLPDLRIITQGGGKLKDELYIRCAEYAADTGRKFIPTYGQTEGTARMAYVPAEYSSAKTGSIGKAIPGGKLYLVDEDGNNIPDPGIVGEMVYEGPNVTLGYAQCREDLLLGDERNGVLFTGDLARMDEDGFFYIMGRKKRFLKLTGLRIGLDECESIIRNEYGIECACTGDDSRLMIYITGDLDADEVRDFIAKKLSLNISMINVTGTDKIPRNEAGKILYSELK